MFDSGCRRFEIRRIASFWGPKVLLRRINCTQGISVEAPSLLKFSDNRKSSFWRLVYYYLWLNIRSFRWMSKKMEKVGEKKIPEKRFLAKKKILRCESEARKKISSFVTETADAKKLLTALVKDRAERNDDTFLSPSLSLFLSLSVSLSLCHRFPL